MGHVDERRRDDVRTPGPLGHLVAVIRDARDRPTNPAAIKRPPHFFARRAGRDRRLEAPHLAKHATAERAEAHAIDRPGGAHDLHDGARELGAVDFQLDDDASVAVAREHIGERRHADTLPGEWGRVAAAKTAPGVCPRQLVGRALHDRAREIRGAVERRIVMDHDDGVAREMDVQLEAVGAEREAVVEGRTCVLGRERAPAAVREHQRALRRIKEAMRHVQRCSV